MDHSPRTSSEIESWVRACAGAWALLVFVAFRVFRAVRSGSGPLKCGLLSDEIFMRAIK